MGGPSRFPRSALVAVGAALLLRLAYVLAFSLYPDKSDTIAYQMGAEAIARGLGYTENGGTPITYYMPGYSIFLGGVYVVAGIQPQVARLVQVLVGAGAVLMAFALARRATGSERAGRIVAWIFALYPAYVFYTGSLLTETLAVALVVTALWLALRVDEGGSFLVAAALGLALGALFYVKVELAYLPAALAGVSLLLPRLRSRFPRFLVAAVVAYAMLGPWIYRNWVQFHAFIPLKDNGGKLLWQSTHDPPYLEAAPGDPVWREAVERLTVVGNPAASDRNFRKEALKNLRAHPGSYVKWCFRRGFQLFFMSHTDAFRPLDVSYRQLWSERRMVPLVAKAVLFGLQSVLTLAGLWALWRTRRNKALWPLQLHFVLSTMTYVLLFGTVRYSMILMPVLFVVAAQALVGRDETILEKRGQSET